MWGKFLCAVVCSAVVGTGCDEAEITMPAANGEDGSGGGNGGGNGGGGHDGTGGVDGGNNGLGPDGGTHFDSGTLPEPDSGTDPTPGDGAFPSPATTGWAHTGVTLSAYTGPSTITADNTVIDSKDITKCLVIDAKNVTIKRSRIKCSNDRGIEQGDGATGLLVEDTEILSTDTSSTNTTIERAVAIWGGGGVTLRRLYIHDTIKGVDLGSNTTIEDSYIADNVVPEDSCVGGCPHSTAIVSFGTADHVVIRHNTLKNRFGATAAVALERDYGVSDDYLIDGNLLATDGGYCFYAGASNMAFVNNKFSTEFEEDCGFTSHTLDWVPSRGGLTWSNNTWYDPGGKKDGQQVPEP
ncbi:MAG: hypothetical protein R3A78_00370 [Polyangiales bacterium]|nr:hypothetical protein [Myxococcales bacterium]